MSGQNSVAGESSESAVDPTKSARGNLQDDTLITSSPRGKKKEGAPLPLPVAKRPNTGQQQNASQSRTGQSTEAPPSRSAKTAGNSEPSLRKIQELGSPQLRRKQEDSVDREKRTDDTKAGLQLQRPMPNLSHSTAAEEAKTADPPRPAPDLPLGVPVPPIPQGRTREPTPEVGDAKQRGVLKSIFSPVLQLFHPGKDGKLPGKAGKVKAGEKATPTRSRSRSPEQWSKVAEDDTEPMVAEPLKENAASEQRIVSEAASPSDQAVKCRPAASDGASSTDGESESCLNLRSPVPAFREVKQGEESESESETGEETCAAKLAGVPVTDEEDGDNDLYEFAFDPYSFIKSLPPLESCVPAWRRALLPKQTRNCKRKTLVLDLDETLVHSTLDFGEGKPDFVFEVSLNNKKHSVNVRQRPQMAKFLQRCSELFELVIFTASQKLYAEQLLNIIDPGRKLIRHRIYRDSCLFVEGNYLKDLTLLGRDLAHTLIIDNSPQAFGFQLANGVPIESWYDDDSDDELLRMLPFLESLVDVPDVRPYIINAFKLHTLVDQAPGYSWS